MNDPVYRKVNVGMPLDRVDARVKATGAAWYAADFPVRKVMHAVVVQSTIASGRVRSIDSKDALEVRGALCVITHLDPPRLAPPPSTANYDGDPFTTYLPVLQNDVVHHFGQHIAVVVAETLEQAQHAARLVRVTYQEEAPRLSMASDLAHGYKPKLIVPMEPDIARGDFATGLEASDVRIDQTYITPSEHNSPMEPHATVAVWEGAQLTLYDTTQNINAVQKTVAITLGLAPENVRVLSPFLGGGFGCKNPVWRHVVLAAVAAQRVGHPVKLVLTRQQMFSSVGYRPQSRQRVRLGAARDGRLLAIGHEIHTQTNVARDFVEHVGVATPMMYGAANLFVTHRAVPLNVPPPTIMRAPGEAPGMFALESAMDELAYGLNIDPIALRIKNDPPRDPDSGMPWSSRSLAACLQEGAARFGWDRRARRPCALRDGHFLIGMGVAAATYPTRRKPCAARATLFPDGHALVQLAATDIGTGTYTVLTQIAADAFALPPERIKIQLGDSTLPHAPGSGGSWGAASFGTAVREACAAVRAKAGRTAPMQAVAAEMESQQGEEAKHYAMHAFGAHFAEVRVDVDTCETRVTRFLGAFAAGRILNPKTATSQLAGGIVMGLGMALTEATFLDERYGHFVNADLAAYHVPVNRDVPAIDIVLLGESDPHVNPLGAKGVGEIGIVGVAAAVANAVYHATGIRVRELPITPEKLLGAG